LEGYFILNLNLLFVLITLRFRYPLRSSTVHHEVTKAWLELSMEGIHTSGSTKDKPSLDTHQQSKDIAVSVLSSADYQSFIYRRGSGKKAQIKL
jgi:hypothetical protein